MDVTTTQAATTTTASTAAQSQPETVINSDFETFLKMLTAQLENQDPLNPLDSQDFAVQLATFSGVEQAVRTNDLLENLGTLFNSSQLSELSGLIGKEVRVEAAAHFSGDPVEVVPTYDSTADTNELIVRNDQGTIIDRRSVNSQTDDMITWNGVGADGISAPYGNYTFSILGTTAGEELPETKAQIYAPVIEARLNGGNTQLVLPGDIVVDQTEISGLRAPQ